MTHGLHFLVLLIKQNITLNYNNTGGEAPLFTPTSKLMRNYGFFYDIPPPKCTSFHVPPKQAPPHLLGALKTFSDRVLLLRQTVFHLLYRFIEIYIPVSSVKIWVPVNFSEKMIIRACLNTNTLPGLALLARGRDGALGRGSGSLGKDISFALFLLRARKKSIFEVIAFSLPEVFY